MKAAQSAPYEKAIGNAISARTAGKGKPKRKKRKMKGPHPGFTTVAEHIAAKQGVSPEEARAMLAASTRNASSAAKKKNPRLKRVKG